MGIGRPGRGLQAAWRCPGSTGPPWELRPPTRELVAAWPRAAQIEPCQEHLPSSLAWLGRFPTKQALQRPGGDKSDSLCTTALPALKPPAHLLALSRSIPAAEPDAFPTGHRLDFEAWLGRESRAL